MIPLRNTDFIALQHALNLQFSERYRNIRLQYSNNQSRIRLCITLFPHSRKSYRMIFVDHVKDFSWHAISSLIK